MASYDSVPSDLNGILEFRSMSNRQVKKREFDALTMLLEEVLPVRLPFTIVPENNGSILPTIGTRN